MIDLGVANPIRVYDIMGFGPLAYFLKKKKKQKLLDLPDMRVEPAPPRVHKQLEATTPTK